MSYSPHLRQLAGMSLRTNAQCFYAILHSEVTDNFNQCFLCTPQIDEAFIQIFKCTSEEAFLKINAFIVGGLAGILAQQGQNKQVHTRTKIHNLIIKGFSESNHGLSARSIDGSWQGMSSCQREASILTKYRHK